MLIKKCLFKHRLFLQYYSIDYPFPCEHRSRCNNIRVSLCRTFNFISASDLILKVRQFFEKRCTSQFDSFTAKFCMKERNCENRMMSDTLH
jgi:hypothetical protein